MPTGIICEEKQVLAPWALVKGDLKRVTLDLRGQLGAYLQIGVGLGGNTPLTNGVDVYINAMLNGDAGKPAYGAPHLQVRSRTTGGVRQINFDGGYPADSSALAFDGSGGVSFAAGERLFFWGVTAIPTASGAISPAHGCEILGVSKGTSTPVVVSPPCRFAKLDNEWFCQADSWSIWVPGGSVVAVTFDYGDDAAGEAVACMADAIVYKYYAKVPV
jgi:hypothetical protein